MKNDTTLSKGKMVEAAGIEAEQVTQAILFFAFYCALMHALPNG